MAAVIDAMHSSKSRAWYTPDWLLHPVRNALGGEIDLDPASCDVANRTVEADRFYSINDDGLAQPWNAERLFCSPPFGELRNQSQAGLFLAKAYNEYQAGRMQQGILLLKFLPASWFQVAWEADAMTILNGPMPFVNQAGEKGKMRQSAFALVYFGNHADRFRWATQDYGTPIHWHGLDHVYDYDRGDAA